MSKSETTTFTITGMTCQKCVKGVRERIKAVSGVTDVVVVLDPGRATVTGTAITADKLNGALADTSYRAYDLSAKTNLVAYLRFYRPLLIMSGIVLVFALAHVAAYGWSDHVFMQYLMAGYFIFFGALKVVGWSGFVASYRQYDDLAKRSRLYARLYPLLEVSIGMTYYIGVLWLPFDIFVGLLMTQKAFSTWRIVRQGAIVQCACLGSFFSIPVTRVTVFEDLLMAVMAFYMIRHTLGF